MEELENLYLEISVLSSIDFSKRVRCSLGSTFNPYDSLTEISKLSLVKNLLAKGIEEKVILETLENPNKDLMLMILASVF